MPKEDKLRDKLIVFTELMTLIIQQEKEKYKKIKNLEKDI